VWVEVWWEELELVITGFWEGLQNDVFFWLWLCGWFWLLAIGFDEYRLAPFAAV
jgi:hypothetical protein